MAMISSLFSLPCNMRYHSRSSYIRPVEGRPGNELLETTDKPQLCLPSWQAGIIEFALVPHHVKLALHLSDDTTFISISSVHHHHYHHLDLDPPPA